MAVHQGEQSGVVSGGVHERVGDEGSAACLGCCLRGSAHKAIHVGAAGIFSWTIDTHFSREEVSLGGSEGEGEDYQIDFHYLIIF